MGFIVEHFLWGVEPFGGLLEETRVAGPVWRKAQPLEERLASAGEQRMVKLLIGAMPGVARVASAMGSY